MCIPLSKPPESPTLTSWEETLLEERARLAKHAAKVAARIAEIDALLEQG